MLPGLPSFLVKFSAIFAAVLALAYAQSLPIRVVSVLAFTV